ncbi:MAG TPA: amino acid adenylation domain-containing protein [Roseiflexaceae bacterium]|nr:amino acid adenylation domain-containing protein [Roseiflexaceae bacterium]
MSNLNNLDALPAEKRELLLKLLQQRKAAAQEPAGGDAITPAPRDRPSPTGVGFATPLSFSQQRLWFLDQFETGTPAFNLVNTMQISGDLHVPTLRRVLDEIVRRHEVLRTVFVEQGGQPLQVILPPAGAAFELLDLDGCPSGERDARIAAALHAEYGHAFDLSRGPLFRAVLIRLDPQAHLLCLNVHHIVFDGWSNAVLVNELMALYRAFGAGQPAPLPPLPVQYADYAVWQRRLLQGEQLHRLLAYWRNQLGPTDAPLNLPTDRPRPAVRTSRGAYCACSLDPQLWSGVKRLAADAGVSAYIVLLAALKALLYRYSNDQRISVGTFIANRTRRTIEPLIGFFVNTLVMRTDLGGDPTFRQLLGRVRETALGAYEHQDLPFEKLIEELQPARDMSRTPFFQVMLVLQNTPDQVLALPGLRIAPFDLPGETSPNASHFDLTFWLSEAGGSLEYNTDLFDPATAERLVAHLLNLLRNAIVAPDQTINAIEIMAPQERAALLEASRPRARYDTERGLHALVEQWARETPDAPAVVCGGQQISYAALDRRAGRLALLLRASGVRPEERVGICVERSIDTLVCVLAVWKAGGAYVPLDPEYPPERLAHMVADSRTQVILTRAALRGALPDSAGQLLLLDDPQDAPAPAPPLPSEPVPGRRLAYLIYTSGSTGAPKGAMVEQRSLVNAALAWRDAYDLRSGMRHLQMASFSFDVFAGDLARALCSGGTLVICPRETLLAPALLYGLIQRERIACGEFVPAVVRELLRYMQGTGRRLPTIERLIVGSDLWLLGEYDQLRERCGPDARVISSYGLSEATIDSTFFESRRADHPPARPVPIGRPFANTEVYILNPALLPVPPGVAGELYIGGTGLARGYHGRPDLTAERFVPNPFGIGEAEGSRLGTGEQNGEPRTKNQEPGGTTADTSKLKTQNSKLYKTGDRARLLPGGDIEFLGRADQQIKVRGFRVEPGEIEAALRRHPALGDALVLPWTARDGGTQLVAYVVPAQPGWPAAVPAPAAPAEAPVVLLPPDTFVQELRSFLGRTLPAHMVPSATIALAALPLTPNGKLDRRALPPPDDGNALHKGGYVAPATPAEQALAAIWAEVLRVERVGLHDDFFALGGHSLLATQVISRVKSALGVGLPLRVLFERPTVAGLAAALADGSAAGPDLPLLPAPRGGPLPLSFSQQRLWFLDQFEPGTPAFNLVSSFRLTGVLDGAALRRTLDEVVRRHEVLRTAFAAENGQPFQIIQELAGADLRFHDLQALAPPAREERARQLILAEGQHSFDLACGPLFRAALLRLGPQEHILCFNIHHIVFDGWSNGVLLRELAALYLAFCEGRPAPLPALPVQYADYAVWQRRLLQGEQLERQLAYWRNQLGPTDAPLNLPTDRPRPAVRTSAGALVPCLIDAERTSGLRALAGAAGVSLYVVVLAALQTLLYRYSHDQRISVGTYIANRHHQAVEPLIGFFVNTLVMRTDLGGSPTFRQLIERVRETALGAYEHQDLPFEKLIEELQPARDMSHTPFFQVMLVLQNTPLNAGELPGLAVEPIVLHDQVHAHFDLTLWLHEGEHELFGSLEYNTDLFDGATAERMAAHLHNLLARIVADPDQSIDTLDLLSPRERAGLLAGGPVTSYPADRPVHLLVQEWAARTPDAPAAIWGDQQLTHAELDRRAERLAGALSALGAGPERRVAIYVERSLETVVCVLAVWKAGAAYVPLDPEYPPERLALMLRDSAPQVLLTTRALAATLPPTDGAVLCLDTPERWPEGQPTALACGANLAYIIYTSGSTSAPKGVMVEHRSLANAFYAWRDAYDLRPGMRHLQMASFSFDVCAGDMVRALCSGGALVICPRELLLDPAGLHTLIQRERPDCAEFVPAVVRELLRHLKATGQTLTHPQLLIVGSDTWLMDEYRQLQACCDPATRVVNSYGLSEATIDSTFFAGGASELSADRVVPIGRPFANTEVYILDRHQAPVPPGVVGELYIGGAGLARGYQGQPDLTAERFVPNPFGVAEAGGWGLAAGEENRAADSDNSKLKTQNSKLYRTGDLARWLPDGAVEFLGRNDRQIKIRGFRIELGEIQTALAQHPRIAEALVTVRSERADGDQLIAYLVPNQALGTEDAERKTQNSTLNTPAGEELKTQNSKLKTYLRERLPEHMIPAWFVWLDAFPLTPNGKIDHGALPAPDLGARALAQSFVPPRDTVEVQLAAIWEEILTIAPVGVQDSFFDLGGHSLLAVHLMARIQQRFQTRLPLNALFGGATIEHLAALLRGDAASPVWSPLVPIQSRGDKAPLFCMPGAGGNVIGFYGLARRLGADRPIYGLQARGLDGETPPHTSVEAMAAEYVAAIRQAQPEGPYLLCGHSFGSWVAFEVAQQLQRQGQPIGLLAIVNTPTPMLMRDFPPNEAQDDTTVLLSVARSIERAFGRSLDLTREQVQCLDPGEQINLLTEALKRVEILPPEAPTAQVRGFVGVFKVNYQITYVPQDWQPVPIVLFRAAERHAEDDDVPLTIRDDPAWGWGELAAGPVVVHVVPGEHLTVLAEPHVQTLAEYLARYLE